MMWSLAKVWNETLDKPRERDINKREHIWASELGGAYIDRYLKMTGLKPTNPPNARSRRKFVAGDLWEDIIKYVLLKAGILIDSQKHLKYQYDGLLEVTGRLDFMAGGKPDYDQCLKSIAPDAGWLPEFVTDATENIIKHFKDKYPNGLEEQILEIKSCSAYMFDLYEARGEASIHHKLQLYHYLKSTGMKYGRIIYVCRDDVRMLEVPILNPSPIEYDYKSDIEKMTHYIQNEEIPPKEKPIVFNPEFLKFSHNYLTSYSQYLTYLYGYENQKEFDDKFKPIVERWNRVLTRIKDGKELTANNKDAISEMEKAGFDLGVITEKIQKDKEAEQTHA